MCRNSIDLKNNHPLAMLSLHLEPLFAARGIDRPYHFLRKNGFTHTTATSLTAGKVKLVNIDYLERLCLILWCDMNDLFHWQPSDGGKLEEDHPLLPLTHHVNATFNFKNAFLKIPLHKAEDLAASLRKEIDGSK
jgi:DNA-binding Xre family transcriptional regulator